MYTRNEAIKLALDTLRSANKKNMDTIAFTPLKNKTEINRLAQEQHKLKKMRFALKEQIKIIEAYYA